jgi:hypothetical protein
MSSRVRREALVRGEELDRVPCLQFILGHTAVVSGRPIAKIYDEARTSIACQRDAREMYGYDGLILHGWANAGGAEFGGEVEYPYRQYTGAPLSQLLADQWGADGYGESAMDAARAAKKLLGVTA